MKNDQILDLLCERFPETFARDPAERQPLQRGIDRDLVSRLDGKTFKERPARAPSGHAIHATNLRRLFPRGPHTAGEVRRFQILEQNFAEDRDRQNDRDAK